MSKRSLPHILHQLNTSLCILKWHSELLPSENQDPHIAFIKEETEHLIQLVQEINPTRIKTLSKESQFKTIEMNAFLEKMFHTFASCDKERSFSRGKSFKNKVFIRLNPFYLKELLHIFLENAFKHTPRGESITLEWAKEKETFLIAICSKGIHLSKKDLPHVWDEHYCACAKTDGSGLGLHIALELAQEMGCRLCCKSDKTTGITFSIHFPANTFSHS